MAARPTWKGYLKVSLVTVPVRVFPATSATGAIRFNQLHAEWPDADPAEEVVRGVRPRGRQGRDRKGLRVREGPLRRRRRRGSRQGETRVHAHHQSAPVRRRRVDRSHLRRAPVLPGAGRQGGGGGVRGAPRSAHREGGHRQAGAPRARVPGRRAAPREGADDVHAAGGERGASDVFNRRARGPAGDRQRRRGAACPAGDRHLRGRPRTCRSSPTNIRRSCGASSTRRSPAKRWSSTRPIRPPRSST